MLSFIYVIRHCFSQWIDLLDNGTLRDLHLIFKDYKLHKIHLLYCRKIGWDVVPGESQLTGLMRQEVLMALVHLGHKETCEEALKRFFAYLDDRKTSLLPVDTRRVTAIFNFQIFLLVFMCHLKKMSCRLLILL